MAFLKTKKKNKRLYILNKLYKKANEKKKTKRIDTFVA